MTESQNTSQENTVDEHAEGAAPDHSAAPESVIPPEPPPEPPTMRQVQEPPFAPAMPQHQQGPGANPRATRSPGLAAFFSLFPGLGNVYNGLYLRGVTFFVIVFGLIGLATGTDEPEAVLLVFSVIFVWLFNIFDAYRQATFINLGYSPELEISSKRRNPTMGSGGLIAGSAVFLLGFYGLLREVFRIDLTILVDYWYLLFMLFGGFLIFQTIRQRRSEDAQGALTDRLKLDL
ncbi:MAG: hypothetical protein AAF560_19385 [Acidobacteriota bacterium]